MTDRREGWTLAERIAGVKCDEDGKRIEVDDGKPPIPNLLTYADTNALGHRVEAFDADQAVANAMWVPDAPHAQLWKAMAADKTIGDTMRIVAIRACNSLVASHRPENKDTINFYHDADFHGLEMAFDMDAKAKVEAAFAASPLATKLPQPTHPYVTGLLEHFLCEQLQEVSVAKKEAAPQPSAVKRLKTAFTGQSAARA